VTAARSGCSRAAAAVLAAVLYAAMPCRAQTPAKDGAASVNGHFELVAIGDLLYSHPFAKYPDPKLQRVFTLLRSGDATVANKEGVLFDLKTFRGSGREGGLLWGEASLGRDMKAIGVDMVSVANNHSMDWGWTGLRDSLRLLDQAGIVYAGGGRNMRAAREAGLLRTPKGVVALIATTSTFNPDAGASDAFEDMPSRPGSSLLRWRRVNLVTRGQMALLRRLATARSSAYEPAPAPEAREVDFGGELYRLSDRPGVHYEMNLDDLHGLLAAVRAARRKANLVVFTIHTHETATGEDDDNPQPPDFLIELAHDVIDAGADVFLGTGIHDLRGIEIYKGRPVFYGMGSFFINGDIKVMRQSALQAYAKAPSKRVTAPKKTDGAKGCFQVRPGGNPSTWYDGMVAVTDFKHGSASTVKLYPLNLGNTCDRSRRGLPHLANPADARRILADVQGYSVPFGTHIAREGSVGVIRIH
jgi:poly-gamma-glutamate capsule biosynthesis protein CapA/YwtB (metallophosphatase superfamily)